MRNLIFWGLFPFALPQAIRLKRTATRLPPPACATEGVVGEGERLRLVGVGDSVIAGVGVDRLQDAFVGQATQALAQTLGRKVHWSVHGRSGARAETLLSEFLPTLPDESADVILLSVGVNDITGLVPLPVWKARLARIIASLRRHSPNAVIGLAGVPPLGGFPLLPEPLRFASGQRGKTFDRAGRRIVRRFAGVVHMPVEFEATHDNFCDDGFHPSQKSYALFGRRMARLVAEELDRSG